MSHDFGNQLDQESYIQYQLPQNKNKETRNIRDPIYEMIVFHNSIWRIIDQVEFQRLRDIKRLETHFLIQNGATYTVFEYSLGVGYQSLENFQQIINNSNQDFVRKGFFKDPKQIERFKNLVTVAGLCYSLGYLPFQSVFQQILNKQWDLETKSCQILSQIMKNLGDKDYLESTKKDQRTGGLTDFKLIKKMIKGVTYQQWVNDDEIKNYTHWVFQIVKNANPNESHLDAITFEFIKRSNLSLYGKNRTLNFKYFLINTTVGQYQSLIYGYEDEEIKKQKQQIERDVFQNEIAKKINQKLLIEIQNDESELIQIYENKFNTFNDSILCQNNLIEKIQNELKILFQDKNKKRFIMDPVHEIIQFKESIWEIIDQPEFQRLKLIKKLGATQQVYNGSTYTAYENCLGVAHISIQYLQQIETQYNKKYEDMGFQFGNDNHKHFERIQNIITVAGLSYNLGSLPYQSILKKVLKDWKLQNKSCQILQKIMKNLGDENYLKDTLDEIKSNQSVCSDFELIEKMIKGVKQNEWKKDDKINKYPYWIFQIVKNPNISFLQTNTFEFIKRTYMSLFGIESHINFKYIAIETFRHKKNKDLVYSYKVSDQINHIIQAKRTIQKEIIYHNVQNGINLKYQNIFEQNKEYLNEMINNLDKYITLNDFILQDLKVGQEQLVEIKKRHLHKLAKQLEYDFIIKNDKKKLQDQLDTIKKQFEQYDLSIFQINKLEDHKRDDENKDKIFQIKKIDDQMQNEENKIKYKQIILTEPMETKIGIYKKDNKQSQYDSNLDVIIKKINEKIDQLKKQNAQSKEQQKPQEEEKQQLLDQNEQKHLRLLEYNEEPILENNNQFDNQYGDDDNILQRHQIHKEKDKNYSINKS